MAGQSSPARIARRGRYDGMLQRRPCETSTVITTGERSPADQHHKPDDSKNVVISTLLERAVTKTTEDIE